jgi:hypothetical protein
MNLMGVRLNFATIQAQGQTATPHLHKALTRLNFSKNSPNPHSPKVLRRPIMYHLSINDPSFYSPRV